MHFSAHLKVKEEVRPLFVVETSANKIVSVMLKVDILGILQKSNSVHTLSGNLKLKS